MITIYRICATKYATLTPDGFSLLENRCNPAGALALYAAQNISLAVLENVVHLPGVPIVPYSLVSISIKNHFKIHLPRLSETEFRDRLKTIKAGEEWLRKRKAVLMKVPSMIVPGEFNYVINGEHPDYRTVLEDGLFSVSPFVFDKRLFS